jgi:hypothetical protein
MKLKIQWLRNKSGEKLMFHEREMEKRKKE